MRVLVCGSRDWNDSAAVEAALSGVFAGYECHNSDATPRPYLIEGGARGADEAARRWHANFYEEATLCGCEPQLLTFPADWDAHGKAAGPIRNQQMVDEGTPDVVLAFKSKDQSRGTDDMIRRSREADIPTYEIRKVP